MIPHWRSSKEVVADQLPPSSSSCPTALAPGGALCEVLRAHYHKGLGMAEYLAGDKVFAKCWSRVSIHKIQNASVSSHPSFQWWGSVGSCASERAVPPAFVTSEMGACSAGQWYLASRAGPSSWPPAGMSGTPLALKKKELSK